MGSLEADACDRGPVLAGDRGAAVDAAPIRIGDGAGGGQVAPAEQDGGLVLLVGDHVAELVGIEGAFDADFLPATDNASGVRIGKRAFDNTAQLGGTLGSGGFADAVGIGFDLEFAVFAAGRGHEDRAAGAIKLLAFVYLFGSACGSD